MPLRARSCGHEAAHPGKLWDEIMTSLLPSEVLSRAADLIEPEGCWTQGHGARDATGKETSWRSAEAVCWCLHGAILHIARDYDVEKASENFVTSAIDGPIEDITEAYDWNDAPDRTQSEVVSALRAASELARREGK